MSLGDDNPTTRVSIYTDGGCDPNPGPGGWGAVIRWDDREWVLSGNDPDTTNNRMELQAAAAALALLDGLLGHCQVELYTDSEYLRRGITEWIDSWVRRGWRTSADQPVKNQDMWRLLHRLVQVHNVAWHWLKGHAGHPLNERADRLATEALRSLQRGPGAPAEPHGVQPLSEEGCLYRTGGGADHPPADERPRVEIYVKASCRGAQGPGGWGVVLRMGEHAKTFSGREASTTANAMLVHGAAEALQRLNRPCQVILHSDAKYLIQGASQWVKNWQARGWRTQQGKPVANRAEWEALLEAGRPHQVTWLLAQGDVIPDDLACAAELAVEASGLEKADSETETP